jgi:hypothetical protein
MVSPMGTAPGWHSTAAPGGWRSPVRTAASQDRSAGDARPDDEQEAPMATTVEHGPNLQEQGKALLVGHLSPMHAVTYART